jgi:5-methylcytosine-specific restriction endonuclease McrA
MKKTYLILFLILFSFGSFAQSRYISETTKKIVFTRDSGICQCCGNSENLEFDHIIPFSCGGGNEASNIQLLCRKCNRSKSNSCYCKIHNKKVGRECCQGSTTKKVTKNNKNLKTNSSSAKQCTGTTKKGSRCKIRTTNSSGRCYHHQ